MVTSRLEQPWLNSLLHQCFLNSMRILGIETSCDETGIAIFDDQAGLLGHQLHSQIDIHKAYGGVVPELASRDHIRRCLPMIHDLLEATGTTPSQLDAIAFTEGPGLIGALLVGASIARSLGYAWAYLASASTTWRAIYSQPSSPSHRPLIPWSHYWCLVVTPN